MTGANPGAGRGAGEPPPPLWPPKLMLECKIKTRRPRRTAMSNTAILLLILAAFVIVGVVIWFRWSADAVTAADNAAGKVVHRQPLPSDRVWP